MSQNPYAPPSAEVADQPEASLDNLKRPGIVTTSLVLLWIIGFMKAGIILFVVYTFVTAARIPLGIVIYCVFLVLYLSGSIWVLIAVGHGRNWARITLAVQAGIEASLMLLQGSGATHKNVAQAIGYYSPVTIYLLGTVLLFVPRANAWFAAWKRARDT